MSLAGHDIDAIKRNDGDNSKTWTCLFSLSLLVILNEFSFLHPFTLLRKRVCHVHAAYIHTHTDIHTYIYIHASYSCTRCVRRLRCTQRYSRLESVETVTNVKPLHLSGKRQIRNWSWVCVCRRLYYVSLFVHTPLFLLPFHAQTTAAVDGHNQVGGR